MSFIKELNNYFFRANAPINPNVPGDKQDNLQKEGVPSQDTMERLVASHVSFRERKDRAKQAGKAYTTPVGTFESPLEDHELVGHVGIETDALAKLWTDGLDETLGSESTKVVHAGQLPDVNSDNQTTTAFNEITNDATTPAVDIETITRTIDPTELRRNNFLLRVSAAFQSYVNNVVESVSNLTTFVFGTGGRDNPGENGSGLSGIIYGTNGTPGSPGADGLMTYIFGPNYDPSNPGNTSCPSVMCDLYGEDGLPGIPGIPGTGGLSSLIPLGLVQMYAGSGTPTGDEWLLCNGQNLNSITDPTLAGLYAVIDTKYGGTGPADFNLPDMEERFPIGAKSGTTPLGQSADNNSFTLLETQVPFRSHGHADTIGITGSVGSGGSTHQHKIPYADSPSAGSDPVDLDNAWEFTAAKGWAGAHAYTGQLIDTDPGSNNTYASLTNPAYMTPDGAHGHDDSFAITGAVTDHPGVAATVAVDNRPSYLSLTYMIKAR